MTYTCWKVHHALASKLLSSLLYSLSIPRRGASVSLLQRRDSDGLLITYLINLLGATKDGQTKSCMYNSHERMVHFEASEWKKILDCDGPGCLQTKYVSHGYDTWNPGVFCIFKATCRVTWIVANGNTALSQNMLPMERTRDSDHFASEIHGIIT